MDKIFEDQSFVVQFCPIITKTHCRAIDSYFGNELVKGSHFCVIIMDASTPA